MKKTILSIALIAALSACSDSTTRAATGAKPLPETTTTTTETNEAGTEVITVTETVYVEVEVPVIQDPIEIEGSRIYWHRMYHNVSLMALNPTANPISDADWAAMGERFEECYGYSIVTEFDTFNVDNEGMTLVPVRNTGFAVHTYRQGGTVVALYDPEIQNAARALDTAMVREGCAD